MANPSVQIPDLDFTAFDKAVDKNKKPAKSGEFDLSVFDNAVKKKETGNVSTNGSEIPLVGLEKSESNPPLQLSQDSFSNYILNPLSAIKENSKPTVKSLDIIERQQFNAQNGEFKSKPEQDVLLQTIISERDNPVAKYNKGKLFLEQDMANNVQDEKFNSYFLNPASVVSKNSEEVKKDILDEGEAMVDGRIPSIAYANARKAQIDKQIADLKNQQYVSDHASMGSIASGGTSSKAENFDELQGKINDLSAYREQLVNYTEPIAKVQVFRATKEKPVDPNDPASQIVNHWGDVIGTRTAEENKYREIGMNYTALFEPITVENKKKSLENGGDNIRNSDIVSIENYGYEKQGIITSIEALDILHSQGKIEDNIYEAERGRLLKTNNQLINKYPVVRMQNIKGALGQILDSNRGVENTVTNTPSAGNIGGLKSLWENIIHAGYSDSEVQSAIDQLNTKGANISKKEAEYLINSKSDIGNTALLGRAIGGTVNFENKLEATAGLQSEIDYENSKHILEQQFANTPNKATEQPQSIISTEGDIESNPQFLQPVKNPDAGLHNWGWGTVNLVADGVGTLAKLYALTELTGGLADVVVGDAVGTEVVGLAADARLGKIVEQTALSAAQRQTIGTIAGMYLDTYQDAKDAAKTFIGEEQGGEQAREMYANLMGLANGIAWTILPANKIVQDITSKSALVGAEDFAKLIPNEGISGLKENTVAKFLENTLKNTAEAQGKITGISSLTQIAQYAAQAMYNPQSVDSRNLGQEVVDGALQGLSFLPITLLEGRGIAKNIGNINEFTKEAIYRVAADPVAFKDYTENQVTKGDITQQQANAKIQLVNTMFDIRTKDVPNDLTKQEKVEYANNLLFTRKLQEENHSIKDPVQTKKNDEKIAELETRRQEILDNSTGILPTQEAVATEPIVTETTQPKDAIELLNQARETGKLGVFKDMEDEAALKMIAEQAQNLDTNGKPYEGTDAAERATMALNGTVNQFGQELVDAAMERYPANDILSQPNNNNESKKSIIQNGQENRQDGSQISGQQVPDKNKDQSLQEKVAGNAALDNKSAASTVPKATDVVGSEVVRKFPKPDKPISEMTADEINAHGKEVKDFYKTQEDDFFGVDGAKKYREAQRISEGMLTTDEKRKEAYATIDQMEKSLTKEQSDAFFGRNEKDDSYIYDNEELRQIARTVRTIEESEDITELSRSLKHPLLDFYKHPKDEGNLASINAAKRRAVELGIDPKELIERAVKNIVKDLPDVGDRELLATSIVEELLKPKEKIGLPENKPSLNEEAINLQTIKSTQNESQKNVNENVGQSGGENSDQQKGNAVSGSENQKRQPEEVTGNAAPDSKGAATSKEEKVGKFEEKARKLAEKIMAAELPSWAKADLPEGTQVQGLDTGKIQKAIADATIKMGQLLDKGVEFGEAVKEAVKDLVDLLGEGMRGKIEEGVAKDYKQNSEEADFTGVRKEKLREIEGAKVLFEKREKKKWSEIYSSALTNIQKMFPNKSLYEGMKTRVREMVLKLNNKELYNPTSEDIAVFNVLRAETHKRIDGIEGLDSDNAIVREAAIHELDNLNNDLLDIARVTNPNGEAGRAFGMLQSEVNTNNGLKIRRMELMKANGGEPLSESDMKWTEKKWEEEKSLMKQEEYARTEKMQDEFNEKIADLQKEYEQKLKEAASNTKNKSGKEKTLSQSGKDIADKIRKLKLTGTKVDFTFGGWNIAVEGIAKLVEGGATVAEAIDKLIKDGVIGFKNKGDQDNFESHLSERINKKTPDEAIDKIKNFADKNDVTDITSEMVKDNLIRDYVNSHVGELDKSQVFDTAFNDLKKILPSITKERFTEAYLKEGEFKQPTKRQLENGIKEQENELKRIAKSKLTADQQQKIKLDAEKENAINKTKEFKRKLENGEFEEPVPVKLKKQDAELIRLKKQQSIIEEQYRKKQQELHEKNKHWVERLADFVRSSYVALLIGRPLTLAKVATMSILRPVSEAATKLSFGKVFDAFFPSISKAALRGGESSSVRSIEKGFQAYFRQFSEKQLEAKYDKANSEYENSLKKYQDYKNSDNPQKETLETLKTDVSNKLIKATGSFIYKFIGGSSLKDAATALVHRSNEIEKQFGKVEGESFNTKDLKEVGGASFLGLGLDNARYILDFIGRSHSAAKTFSGRFSFAAGFMARLEGAARSGEDISSADKVLEIAHESYLDWERGKYQQSNAISDLWNKVVNGIAKGETEQSKINTAKAMETLLKGDVAITRVPVNILHESIMEYTLGAFRAAVMAYKATSKAKGELKSEGADVNSPEFKEALKERISQMDEKQAATIARAFRKGGLGIGLYALALISGAIHFGIFPHLGQKKKKEEEDLRKGELNPGDIVLGDSKMNHNVSSIIEHIPALWPTFMGLGMAQAYKEEINNGKTTPQAVAKSIQTHLQIIESGIPQTQIVSPSRVLGKVFDIAKKRLTDTGIIDNDKTIFTNEQSKDDNIQFLKEKGIYFKPPTASEHKVDIDEEHPNGKMMAEELDKFKEITKDIYLNGVEEVKGKDGNDKIESISELLDGTYKVSVKNKDGKVTTETFEGRDLPEEELKKLVSSLKEKATKYAEKQLGLKSVKDKVTIKKIND